MRLHLRVQALQGGGNPDRLHGKVHIHEQVGHVALGRRQELVKANFFSSDLISL